jgi:hypothetical protein
MYLAAFYLTPLPSVCNDAGEPLRRIDLLLQLLLRPDDWLLPNWFGAPAEFSIADRLPVWLVAAVILAWAATLGWLLLKVCGAGKMPAIQLTALEVIVFALAIGLNLLSTWVLLLGLFGVLGRLWVFVAPAAVTVAAASHVWRRNSRRLTAAGTAGYGSDLDNAISLRWLWLAAPFVLAILLAAVTPPLDFDVREYHLQAPKEFFQQGRITFLPHNVYANMAMGTEMLSLLAMVVAGDWWLGALAGKTVIAAFTPLTALALVAAGRRFFSPAAGVAAALLYLSVPWIVSIASGGFVEGASACYLLLAIYALLLVRSTHPTLPLALAGYFAGAAVATKYPAVLFVFVPLAFWIGLAGFRRRKARGLAAAGTAAMANDANHRGPTFRRPLNVAFRRPLNVTVFLLAAVVACGLWFGKNWALAGNPTYPLLYEVFGGKTWTAEKEQQWSRVHRPRDFSPRTLAADIGRVAIGSEWLSPLIVPLVVLALWSKARSTSHGSRVWWLLAYAGFVIAVWWLCTHRIDRFWIPVLPVLALLAGVGASWSSQRWWRWMLAGLLAVGLGANFLVASMGPGNAWFVSLARLRDDPDRVEPWHRYFNAHLTRGRLLTVGDAAVFDLAAPVLYNTCFDDCRFEQMVKGKTPGEVRAALAAAEVSYVYVHWGEIARYRNTGYGFTDFVQPAVFDRLVAQGVLDPLPPIEGHPGRAYRVK